VTVGPWAFVPLLLVGARHGTYIRNQAWESERSLWEDAMARPPGESRPYHMLAGHHYDRIGGLRHVDAALQFVSDAAHDRVSHEALTLNNMAAIYYGRKDHAPRRN